MLESFGRLCRKELDTSIIPFWLKHSPDREYGGYLNALERDGTPFDTTKYMWMQGRAVWMFSRLYNQWARKEAYLDAARVGADFIRRKGRDRKGRIYFSVTREGRPVRYQRKPYGTVFVMLGLLEYGRAANDAAFIDEARRLFWRIVRWIEKPHLVGKLPVSAQARLSILGDEMCLMLMAMELLAVADCAPVRAVLAKAVNNTLLHYDAKRRILVEHMALDGRDLMSTPEGRLVSPGHSIELAWFLLHALEHLGGEVDRARVRDTALKAIEGTLEFGWDSKYGGLFHFMDILGKPTLVLEYFMKVWWPHTEALYALVLASIETGDRTFLRWLRRVREYTWRHFPDPKYGEWFGYLDRQGNVTHTSKGTSYKGFFHVPRFLMMSAQRIERQRPCARGNSPLSPRPALRSLGEGGERVRVREKAGC